MASAKKQPKASTGSAAAALVVKAVEQNWPADTVERWDVSRLMPYARNARIHSEDQVDQLAKSIAEFGWTIPVVVDEKGELIAGHGRVLAAKKLNLKDVPTIVARGWSEERKKAYRLADNQQALNSSWDDGLLKAELIDLQTAGVDFVPIGFAELELSEILESAGTTPETERAPRAGGLGSAVIQFNIVFDDETQQQSWFEFVKRLKTKYPDCETLGARLARHIQDGVGGDAQS